MCGHVVQLVVALMRQLCDPEELWAGRVGGHGRRRLGLPLEGGLKPWELQVMYVNIVNNSLQYI